jgi:hypothetical protein
VRRSVSLSRYLGEDPTIIVLANLADADLARFVDGIASAETAAGRSLTSGCDDVSLSYRFFFAVRRAADLDDERVFAAVGFGRVITL